MVSGKGLKNKMSREETVRIVRIMFASYPSLKKTQSEVEDMVTAWDLMFSDFTYNQVSMALKSYIMSDTSGFPPTVGQLVNILSITNTPMQLNEMEAWNLVSKAIRNGVYHSAEEFDKLPEMVKKAVGNSNNLLNWATTDYNAIETVIQSNFIKTYREVVKNYNTISKMPLETQNMITSINTKPQLENSNTPKIEMNNDNFDYTIPDDIVEKIEMLRIDGKI